VGGLISGKSRSFPEIAEQLQCAHRPSAHPPQHGRRKGPRSSAVTSAAPRRSMAACDVDGMSRISREGGPSSGVGDVSSPLCAAACDADAAGKSRSRLRNGPRSLRGDVYGTALDRPTERVGGVSDGIRPAPCPTRRSMCRNPAPPHPPKRVGAPPTPAEGAETFPERAEDRGRAASTSHAAAEPRGC